MGSHFRAWKMMVCSGFTWDKILNGLRWSNGQTPGYQKSPNCILDLQSGRLVLEPSVHMLPHEHIRQGKPFLSPGFLRLVGQCIPHWGGQGLNGPAHGNQQTNLPRFETVGFEVKRSIPRALRSCPLDDWWG